MSVETTNLSAEAQARYDQAAQLGLAASANVLVREVKKAFGSDYYKGGAFRSTLFVKQRIYYLTPYRNAEGLWETQVGTPVKQALYWELGHRNVFTRNPNERKEIWVPTAVTQADAMRRAFARVVARTMGAK